MPTSYEKNFDETWIEMTSVLEQDESGRFSHLPTAEEMRSKWQDLRAQSNGSAAPKFEVVFQAAYEDKWKREAPQEKFEPVTMIEMQDIYETKKPGSRIRHIDEMWEDELNSLDETLLSDARKDVAARRISAFERGKKAGLKKAVSQYDPEFEKDYDDLELGSMGSLIRNASENDRFALSEQALNRINEAGAKAVFMGDPDSDKFFDVFKQSAYRVNSEAFAHSRSGFHFGEEAQVPTESYREEEIRQYMENLRQFGKNGGFETALSLIKMSDMSDDLKPVQEQLKALQDAFMNREPKKEGMDIGIPQNASLPCFSSESLENLDKSCENYLSKNGYKNTKENKLVRDIQKSAYQSQMIRAKSEQFGQKEDSIESTNYLLSKRLEYLSKRLNDVGKHRLGRNSPEFTNMKNTLDRLAKDGINSPDDVKELQEAAQYYMDKKGGASRSTDKGQIRYDIAKELTDLAKIAREKEPTKEEMKEFQTKLNKKPEKVSFKDLEREDRAQSRPLMSDQDYKEYSKAMADIYEKSITETIQRGNKEIKAPGKGK